MSRSYLPKLLIHLAMLMLACATWTSYAQTTSQGASAWPPVAGRPYCLVNLDNGLALSAGTASDLPGEGDRVTLGARSGLPYQRWSLDPTGPADTWRLTHTLSLKVLDVDLRNSTQLTLEGTPLIVWNWHQGTNQTWHLEKLPDGTVKMQCTGSGFVADVGAPTSGGHSFYLQQKAWAATRTQKWRLEPL